MLRLRDSWRTSLPASQQPRNPPPESIARNPYHSSPSAGPRQSCGSGTACEAACDRSVPVFPEHPVQGVKGAVREPPCARQKSVVLSFLAVGWRRPSLLMHLALLRHCRPRRARWAVLTPRPDRRAFIKPCLRRRTRTRVVHPCHHVLGSFQWYELGLG